MDRNRNSLMINKQHTIVGINLWIFMKNYLSLFFIILKTIKKNLLNKGKLKG